jgi:hypothetical protein
LFIRHCLANILPKKGRADFHSYLNAVGIGKLARFIRHIGGKIHQPKQ